MVVDVLGVAAQDAARACELTCWILRVLEGIGGAAWRRAVRGASLLCVRQGNEVNLPIRGAGLCTGAVWANSHFQLRGPQAARAREAARRQWASLLGHKR